MRTLAWGFALLVASPALFHAQAQEGGCGLGDVVDSAVTIDGCEQALGSDLAVVDGGVLTVRDAVLSGTITIEDGGALVLDDASLSAGDAALRIRFLSGSSGILRDATLSGHDELRIASPDVTVSNVVLADAGTAIAVEGSLTFKDITVSGSQAALRVEEGGSVRVVNSTLAGQTAISADRDASVLLEGTSRLGAVVLGEGASLESGWFARVAVTAPADGGVAVGFQDATGHVHHGQVLSLQGGTVQTSWLLLPAEGLGAVEYDLEPYRVIVTQGTRANHTAVVPGMNQAIAIQVPDDADADHPVWPPGALWHDGAGFSNDGTVHLFWLAANDTMGGDHPNRAVHHYRVLGGEVVHIERTLATETRTEGLDEGLHTLRVEAVDLIGRANATDGLEILVDVSAPAVDFAADVEASGPGAYDGPVNVTVTTADAGSAPSGLAALRWRLGEGPTTNVDLASCDGLVCDNSASFDVPLGEAGNHTLHVVAQDRAGNRQESQHEVVIDTSAPTFRARLQPSLPVGAWHREAPTLAVTILEPGPSGPGDVRWRLDAGDWHAYNESAPPLVDVVGEHELHVEAGDGAGNTRRMQLRHAFDPDPPVLSTASDGAGGASGWFTGPAALNASATDDGSGVERIEYRIASGAWRPMHPPLAVAAPGPHDITVRAVDAAGNEAVEAVVVRIDPDAPTPPAVDWAVLPDGRVRADWSHAPPLDAASGVARVTVEREAGTGVDAFDVEPDAPGHVLVGLPNGEHRLRVRVADTAGHEAVTAWTAVPVANSTAVADAVKKVRGALTLRPSASVAAEDLVEVRYFLDGTLRGSVAAPPHSFTVQTRELADGPHEVRIVAVDAQGLHHEELRVYNVRNGYLAVLVDEAFSAGVALVASAGALAVASFGFVRWRRWTL